MAVIVQGYPKHNQRMKLSGMESQSIGFMPHVNAPLSKHSPAIARPYGLVQTPRGVKEATPVQDLEYIRARVLHYIDADAVLMVWRCGSAVSSPGCTSEAFVWIIKKPMNDRAKGNGERASVLLQAGFDDLTAVASVDNERL